jgi:hypothetical protein
MHHKIALATALAFAVAHDLRTQRKANKDAKAFLQVHDYLIETMKYNEEAANAQIKYLCHMLDEHDIPVDEFDLIVLNYNQVS